MKCPDCGLENPPSALRCDCGYVLPAHEMPNSTQEKHSLLFWMFAWLLFGLGIILALFILVGGLSLARSFLGRSLIGFLGSLLAIPLAVAIVATLYRVYRNSCWRCRSFATMSLKRKFQEGDNSVKDFTMRVLRVHAKTAIWSSRFLPPESILKFPAIRSPAHACEPPPMRSATHRDSGRCRFVLLSKV